MSDSSVTVRWLIDTREIWQGMPLKKHAFQALQLIKPPEQAAVDKYYQIKDAKMCLASYLLKYLVIARLGGVPWKDVIIGEGPFRKPCYIPSHSYPQPVDFNVSHQAGLVALVGQPSSSSRVGIDIVCVNERNDYGMIDSEGFDNWVDMYKEVFSSQEIDDIKNGIPDVLLEDGTVVSFDELGAAAQCYKRNISVTVRLRSGETKVINSNILIEEKLRRFYAFWCLKEAYIKMTGEALMASWLRDLEFRNVRAPRPVDISGAMAAKRWSEIFKDVEIWFEGKRIHNTQMELQAFEGNYLIATASSNITSSFTTGMVNLPNFEELNLEKDIYSHAE